MKHIHRFIYYFIVVIILLSFYVVTVALNAPQQQYASGQIVIDAYGVEMVYAPGRTIHMGIDFNRATEFCQKYQTSSETEQCIGGLREYTGATYTDSVDIQSFWIDKYEMTYEVFNDLCQTYGNDGLEPCDTEDFLPENLQQTEQQPVSGVTWFTAVQVCAARNARLPREAEWEYVAAGLDQFFFPWGDDYRDNVSYTSSVDKTRTSYPVGSSEENVSWIGVYDLAGNVAEWTEDRYIERILANVSEPSWPNPDTFNAIELARVVKGGSWISDSGSITTFYRDKALPSDASQYIGFRCARSLPPT
jgi:formylglycine-generating enzyme